MAHQKSGWNRFKRDLYNTFRSNVDVDYGIKGHPMETWDSVYGDFVIPCTDIYTTNGELVISVDMPGLEKEDIEVNITENEIEIRAKKSYEDVEEDTYYIQSERAETGFYRRINLPEEINSEKATAHYENGVLKISAPRISTGRKRFLEIE